MVRKGLGTLAAVLAGCIFATSASAEPLSVIAAENFYGDVARQIGGEAVSVTSILTNPDQDPHLFEASPATARLLAEARITIANGIDYDPWMDKLLVASPAPAREDIVVATLLKRKTGDNPHLWYEPQTMTVLAHELETRFTAADPQHKDDYARNTARFLDSLKRLDARVAEIRQRSAGTPVTASEPVFGYMAQALGLKMRNERFQLAVQNNAEPRISDVAAFERDLKEHRVKVMIFNRQADEPSVQRLVAMARNAKIPVIGITETQPEGISYQDWMLGQLDTLDAALRGQER